MSTFRGYAISDTVHPLVCAHKIRHCVIFWLQYETALLNANQTPLIITYHVSGAVGFVGNFKDNINHNFAKFLFLAITNLNTLFPDM